MCHEVNTLQIVCTFNQIPKFQIFNMHLTLRGKERLHLPSDIANDVSG
jgi:hypothetical protein